MEENHVYSHNFMKEIERELKKLIGKPLLEYDMEVTILVDYEIAEGEMIRKRLFRKNEVIQGQYIKSITVRSSRKPNHLIKHLGIPSCTHYGVERMMEQRTEFKLLESALNSLDFQIKKLNT